MARTRRLFVALFVGASFVIAGCADSPTAPQPEAVEPNYGLLSGLTDLLLGGGGSDSDNEVTVLQRRVPLEQDEVVSQVVGRWGGVIRLPEAGLTVLVPWGALDEPTEITVTAPSGNLVGYHFAPHGLDFDRPVTVTQDLLSTESLLNLDLSVAYFEGDLEPTVNALESLPLWLLRVLGIFRIEHFSGYVIAVN
jgi:hypothetical protein